MKVLLFVQNDWNGRPPRAVGRGGIMVNGKPFLPMTQDHALRCADRWWLVECESADAGRLIIACSRGDCDSPEGCVCRRHGRILASGVKR